MQEFKCAHEDGGEILFQRLPKTDTEKAGGPGHTGLNVGLLQCLNIQYVTALYFITFLRS